MNVRKKMEAFACAALVCAGCAHMPEDCVVEGSNPAISRDGTKLAFQRVEGMKVHLGVYDLKTGETTWIARGATEATKAENACHPAWGPNGELVFAYANITNTAYQRFSSKGPKDGYGLRVWKDGKCRDIVRGLERDFTPSFSPDGKAIYCARQTKDYLGLVKMDADGRDIRPYLAAPVCDSGLSQPVVSPDGRLIVWAEMTDYYGIWSLKLAKEGSPLEQVALTAGDHSGYAPNWCPDSRHIVYTGFSDGDDGWSVYVMDVADGATKRLALGEDPCVSPDGKWVYYGLDGKILRTALAYPEDKVKSKSEKLKGKETVVFRKATLGKDEKLVIPSDGTDGTGTRFIRFSFTCPEKPLGNAGLVSVKFNEKSQINAFVTKNSPCFFARELSGRAFMVNDGTVPAKGRHVFTGIVGADGAIYLSVDGRRPIPRTCALGLSPLKGDGALTAGGNEAVAITDFEFGRGWPTNVPAPLDWEMGIRK